MMEFTLARVSACICGIAVIAILFNPVVASYDDRAEDGMGDSCQALGEMFDSFMDSGTDEATMSLSIMLPDSDSQLSFEGHTMTMENQRGRWTYELRCLVEPDAGTYDVNDFLILSKDGGTMVVRSV